MIRRPFIALLILPLLGGCAVTSLLRYKIHPDLPRNADLTERTFAQLSAPVEIRQSSDGIWHIQAQSATDAAFVGGYLQARDRMFQLDILRHLAQGRVAELVGNVPLGHKTALELDRFNRFLGLWDQAKAMEATIPADERELVDAAVAGINAWLAEGHLSLEHRLLGIRDVEPWTVVDSLSVLRLFMFNLTHNYTRELRRLMLACAVGVDGMQLIWPADIEFPIHFLPDELIGDKRYDLPPAVTPEIAAELPTLCPETTSDGDGSAPTDDPGFKPSMGALPAASVVASLEQLSSGLEASNNWVVGGTRTKSGKPIVSNDPHLAHMNPPIVWGMDVRTPTMRQAGFALVGLHRITMGHNGHVAWGATINNVDMQDLFVVKLDAHGGRELVDGRWRPVRVRTESFHAKGLDEPVTFTVRYTSHGPLLTDMDPTLRQWVPPVALQTIDFTDIGDAAALAAAASATTANDFVAGLSPFDSACINWVFADTDGNFGWTSPCRIPIRRYWLGTFPAPGWSSRYTWDGTYEKEAFVPSVIDPQQGYIATANNRPLPSYARPTAYNNDPSSPNRFRQIRRHLEHASDLTVTDMARIQTDVMFGYWAEVTATIPAWCARADGWRQVLCDWDMEARSDSTATTIFVRMTHELLDLTMGDRLPGGRDSEFWRFIQDIPHFEQNVDWLLLRPATDPIWDLPGTVTRETKADTFSRALATAVASIEQQVGPPGPDWAWGRSRPFILKHLFGGKKAIAGLVNSPAYPGRGLPNTVFKNQFNRADRKQMHVTAGPAMRINIDMADPEAAVYDLAGGESGWPESPYYANDVPNWLEGHMHPLSATDGETIILEPTH